MSDDDGRRLEAAIAAAGQGGAASVVDEFARSTVVVPSGAPVGEGFEGFVPVLYDRDGTPMLAVFTSLATVGDVASLAPYALTLTGRELVQMMPPATGIVVNPGHTQGFEMLPDGVARLRASLAAGPSQ